VKIDNTKIKIKSHCL